MTVRVAALQTDIVWEDAASTHARLGPQVAAAAGAGARLILLPEMFATGFSMAADRIAEPPDGPSTAFLVEAATRHDAWVGGSIAIRDPGAPADDRPANTFVLAAPDGTTTAYRKLHPFSYSGEHEHYRAGEGFTTVDVDGLRTTLFVCYDLRFADEFWATAPRTDCYAVVANWPSARRHHWSALLLARAIENQAYVVGVNRVGRDGNDLAYAGDSAVVDPMGRVLASASEVETMLLSDVDPAVVAATRDRFPFLADRRPTSAVTDPA